MVHYKLGLLGLGARCVQLWVGQMLPSPLGATTAAAIAAAVVFMIKAANEAAAKSA